MKMLPTRISVAMCTYNGERFLPQQLASIAAQTRLPDELVVCDDRSTDRTVAIVREFAASVPFPVKVFENERNLGYSANFEAAIRRCEGDLIALSDQDDIWYPQHLETLQRPFLEPRFPPVGWVYSNLDEIDESGAVVNRRFLDLTSAEHPKTRLDHLIDRNQYVLPSASLLSRSAFEAVGGFDESLSGFD